MSFSPSASRSSASRSSASRSSPFNPSDFQQAIFDFQAQGQGDAFVDAVAGSGKTTTLKQLAQRLPVATRERAVFLAFNAHIAEELSRALPPGMKAHTIHSLGMRALRNHYRPAARDWVDKRRQRRMADYYFSHMGQRPLKPGVKLAEVKDAALDLLRFSMLTLTDPKDGRALASLAAHFGVEVPDWSLVGPAVETLRCWTQSGIPGAGDKDLFGQRNLAPDDCISFDDMVYLPVALDLPVPQFDMIYCDEAQDLNAAQRELVLKMRAPRSASCPDGGRIIFVGDPFQAIYGFAGADAESVHEIQRATGATSLPLSICYRCPKSHLALARQIVPHIEAAPDAPEGVVVSVKRDQVTSAVRHGDMILCRCTAPLIKLVFELIAEGIPAKVRGRDIGTQLTKIIDAVEASADYGEAAYTDPEKAWKDFARFLALYRQRMTSALSVKEDSEMLVEALWDRVDSVDAVYARKFAEGKCKNAGELRAHITALFDDGRPSVMLSTVHKAKGLEADRVLILREDLMPHPKAKRDHEITQEWNLRYVALTRAKKELLFIEE